MDVHLRDSNCGHWLHDLFFFRKKILFRREIRTRSCESFTFGFCVGTRPSWTPRLLGDCLSWAHRRTSSSSKEETSKKCERETYLRNSEELWSRSPTDNLTSPPKVVKLSVGRRRRKNLIESTYSLRVQRSKLRWECISGFKVSSAREVGLFSGNEYLPIKKDPKLLRLFNSWFNSSLGSV